MADHFINTGYGWVCSHCSPEMATLNRETEGRARFFHEGEAEDKEPALSTVALARWSDASRQALVCPRCGIQELINRA